MRILLQLSLIFLTALPAWAGQLDIVIVSNGGLSSELGYSDQARFEADALRVMSYHMAREPYLSRSADIVWHTLWQSTSLGCKRSSTMSRLITCNQESARLAVQAAGLPVERGIILVNTTGYGGSGGTPFTVAYNGYTTSSDPLKVAFHEFGHTLGGLVDEYNLYPTNGTQTNAWYGQCWKGVLAPTMPGTWVKGCYRPNFWRQKVGIGNSVMHSLNNPAFNPKSLELLNARIDAWVNQP